MQVDYTVQVWKEAGQFIAHAMPLDVASAGDSPEGARQAVDEAVKLFLRTAAEHGTLDEVLVDGFAMKLVMKPQQYDVVVTTTQFGDILTDEGAGIVGGLGLAPGLCVGERQAMAQATHGSAPDIAGKGIANPYAMIMSGKMLFEWLGRKRNDPKAIDAAQRIERSMDRVIADAKILTSDLGGKASTSQMGDAVAAGM